MRPIWICPVRPGYLYRGNASAIDRESGYFVIKPSGVDYEKLRPEDMVVMDLQMNRIEGELNPSSDTATHCELYKAFPEIGGLSIPILPGPPAGPRPGGPSPATERPMQIIFTGRYPAFGILQKKSFRITR